MVHFVSEHESKVKTVNFHVCKNPPKLIGYQATSLGLAWNLCWFCNPHTYIYQSWNVGEDRFSSYWDIRWDRQLFAVSFQKYNFSHFNLRQYWTKVHHICTRCRGIISAIKLLIHIAIFHSVLKYQGAEWRSFHQFCPKLVAMATCFEELEQEGPAVASIVRDVVVYITPPATTMRGKFGSEFEISYNAPMHFHHRQTNTDIVA